MNAHYSQFDWIVFDADETLFHFDALRGLQLTFAAYGFDFSHAEFDRYKAVNIALWQAYERGEVVAAEVQVQRFEYWGNLLNQPPMSLNQHYLRTMGEICEMLPGAASLLTRLAGKVRLGIITNGFASLQPVRLERMGITDIIDLLVVSELVGVAKPEQGIFDYALKQMGDVAAERVLMVGDNLYTDIKGGNNAGMKTCWLNNGNYPLPDDVAPTWVVPSMHHLERLLFPVED
ncbi:pyrimidine 5'-nucleotidase [Shewanella avicenniae]|uniref:Pyrimidine 5'-nucleotidase n=1 Tax=Shewanella avicenniae TaxID=2814294 RepID=A0ABX7QR51_9GAMM|nr:pyrimidine 5'-nucleotidase [Shewanella avicenniae]QSX33942.1 pyrimidine 5'-nucleotidase [Shewanella avicenniae]